MLVYLRNARQHPYAMRCPEISEADAAPGDPRFPAKSVGNLAESRILRLSSRAHYSCPQYIAKFMHKRRKCLGALPERSDNFHELLLKKFSSYYQQKRCDS